MCRNYYILYLLLVCIFAACAPRSLREAQSVVAQADSLWKEGKLYGMDEGDSATLAQAYETLGSLSLFNFHFSPSYAHACYHYGKLLRAKEHPVEAMQAFISATHSGTKDYHILGRVYSNMGDIAHLAGEFPLAYDMYERSGQMYLHNGDSLLYYYDLNNMAYELAEQGNVDLCIQTTEKLISCCYADNVLLGYAYFSIAEAYLMASEPDSAIYYAHKAKGIISSFHYADMQLAQAYYLLGENDSSVYYANVVLANSNNLFLRNNALYILTNNDEGRDIAAIREVAAERSDTQKLIEIRQGKLSQAVQLLEQDMARKPDLAWLYAICATLAVVGLVAFLYVYRKRRQHTLLSQQVNALENINNATKQQHELIVQEHTEYKNKMMAQVEETCTMLRQSPHLSKDLNWNDFEKMCYVADQQLCMIASKLRQKQILNETEVRLCILVLLDLSRKQISDTLPYSLNSVGKLKDHTAKLLGTTGKNLRDFLLYMAVEG